MGNFKLVETEGEFSLWCYSSVYKVYQISNGYIRNVKTGENCGKDIKLYKRYHQDGECLMKPIYDEDCYEFVFEVQ